MAGLVAEMKPARITGCFWTVMSAKETTRAVTVAGQESGDTLVGVVIGTACLKRCQKAET